MVRPLKFDDIFCDTLCFEDPFTTPIVSYASEEVLQCIFQPVDKIAFLKLLKMKALYQTSLSCGPVFTKLSVP